MSLPQYWQVCLGRMTGVAGLMITIAELTEPGGVVFCTGNGESRNPELVLNPLGTPPSAGAPEPEEVYTPCRVQDSVFRLQLFRYAKQIFHFGWQHSSRSLMTLSEISVMLFPVFHF